jgi:hypothetical protein
LVVAIAGLIVASANIPAAHKTILCRSIRSSDFRGPLAEEGNGILRLYDFLLDCLFVRIGSLLLLPVVLLLS